MSYLKFDKNLMINLEQSLPKEMLRTNQSGAYHCTTIVDCNTRKQHGLLVVPVPELGNSWHVMLSSLDETVYQHGAPFNLGLHRYQGGVMNPNGHKYIREFDCENVPRTTYRVGGVILTTEKIFISGASRILIRYTLAEAHSPTTLRFRPVLAFRDANELCVANDVINTEIPACDNGVSACLYDGYPRLFMQFSTKPEWTYDPHWYNGFEYIKDLERGVPYTEDLWVPGYFDVPIEKGQSIIFSAGLSEVDPAELPKMYEKEIANRTQRTSFFNCLKNAVKQCYLSTPDGMYLLSGYPWGKVIARNIFMALPGATIAINHRADFEKIAETALSGLRTFMETGELDPHIQGIDLPDVPLWAIWALQQYAKAYSRPECGAKYLDDIRAMIKFIQNGKHPFMHVDEETGMVWTDGGGKPMSWMNASLGGHHVVPRTGYLVEFNALWYNALIFASRLTEGKEAEEYTAAAEKMTEPFVKAFLNDYGYLYDYVNGSYADPSVRPNMAIAIGLDYSPLDRRQRKRVLDIVTRELLTPKG
ncbi:MAG: amylo-alpha-1,6-glucosidase, partial [Duncaniella sp.]|nr:amylo-alpha-1,6-glucosidase [Duncaniella sp.]